MLHVRRKLSNEYSVPVFTLSYPETDMGVIFAGDLGHVTAFGESVEEEGDCRYLTKEVLEGDFSALHKADVFALGMIALELCTKGSYFAICITSSLPWLESKKFMRF